MVFFVSFLSSPDSLWNFLQLCNFYLFFCFSESESEGRCLLGAAGGQQASRSRPSLHQPGEASTFTTHHTHTPHLLFTQTRPGC